MELAGAPNPLVAASVERYPPQGLCKRCFLEQNWNIGARSAICG